MGFVLHQRPFRETSAISELFTESEGRVSVLAKGVRGVQKRGNSKNLTPFRLYQLDWSGRGDLPFLKLVEPLAAPYKLMGDAIFAGLYANELLLRLCIRNDPHAELFAVYHKLLVTLEHDGEGMDIALRYFERDLLTELGYGLDLDVESLSGAPIKPDAKYIYHLDQGVLPVSENAANTTQTSISGAALLALSSGSLEGIDHRREVRKLLRYVLKSHLGERPLNSIRTLQRMKQISRNRPVATNE